MSKIKIPSTKEVDKVMAKTLVTRISSMIAPNLTPAQREHCLLALNKHHTGSEHVNKVVDGKIVPIGNESPELVEAHYALCRSQYRQVILGIYSDGSIEILPE